MANEHNSIANIYNNTCNKENEKELDRKKEHRMDNNTHP